MSVYWKPNPRQAVVILNPVDVPGFRRLLCDKYNRCLDKAEAAKWASWHCNECDAFRPITADQGRQDMLGMAEMWGTASRLKMLEQAAERRAKEREARAAL